MNHIKLTLAITLTALAFLCACDDSNSASADTANTPANEETNTQTQPAPYTTNDQYIYTFYNDDSGCGIETSLVSNQYIFTPSTSSIDITTKDANGGIETVSGKYRDATSDDGSMYYLIYLENFDANINYKPDESLTISKNEIPIKVLTNNTDKVNALVTEYCSK